MSWLRTTSQLIRVAHKMQNLEIGSTCAQWRMHRKKFLLFKIIKHREDSGSSSVFVGLTSICQLCTFCYSLLPYNMLCIESLTCMFLICLYIMHSAKKKNVKRWWHLFCFCFHSFIKRDSTSISCQPSLHITENCEAQTQDTRWSG